MYPTDGTNVETLITFLETLGFFLQNYDKINCLVIRPNKSGNKKTVIDLKEKYSSGGEWTYC